MDFWDGAREMVLQVTILVALCGHLMLWDFLKAVTFVEDNPELSWKKNIISHCHYLT